MGTQANDLALGCDCLGTIHYIVSLLLVMYAFRTQRPWEVGKLH